MEFDVSVFGDLDTDLTPFLRRQVFIAARQTRQRSVDIWTAVCKDSSLKVFFEDNQHFWSLAFNTQRCDCVGCVGWVFTWASVECTVETFKSHAPTSTWFCSVHTTRASFTSNEPFASTTQTVPSLIPRHFFNWSLINLAERTNYISTL